METASNKKGCWERNAKTGKLVFHADAPTKYKPPINPSNKDNIRPSVAELPIVLGALAGAWELRCGYVPYWEQWAIARIAGDSEQSENLNGIRVVKVKDARIVLSQLDNAYEATGGVEFEGADLALDFSGRFTRAWGTRFEHRRGHRTVRLTMSDGKLLVHGESGEPPRDTGPEFTNERHIFCEGFKATP